MQQPQKPFTESGTSPPRRATVTHVEITPGCTVGIGHAVDADGRELSFVGDWRPMLRIAEDFEAGQHVEVWLHQHQVICWQVGR